jgi:voltage-gated potassium channel Kch
VAVGALRRAVEAAWGPKWRWLTITVVWVATAGLYLWGVASVADAPSWWDRLYGLPKLFSLGVDGGLAAKDGRIQAARFIGPLIFATTFFAATAIVFRDQWNRLRLRFTRDHVVVAGLGDKGSRVAASLRDTGRRVVAIERDPTNGDLAGARRRGITVVVGDATDRAVLAEAGVSRAAELVVLCDSDGTNAEVVDAVRGLPRDGRARPLNCRVHLVAPQLSRLLRTRELAGGPTGLRLDFFNVYQRGARQWLAAAAPFDGDQLGRPPHLVVVGVGNLGESLVVLASQRWADRSAEPLALTIMDGEASSRAELVRLRHPALEARTTIATIDLDTERPTREGVDGLRRLEASGTVTAVFVALDDDTRAIAVALSLRQGLGRQPCVIHVRTRFEGGLSRLVDDGVDDGLPVQLRTFPLLDRTCTAEAITGGTNEYVARALHDDYVEHARADGRTGEGVQPWATLPEDVREANRRAADHLVLALRSVGLGLQPQYGWDGATFALTDAEVDALARAEHDRWAADRRAAGWRYGPERDDEARLNPLLGPWDDLPAAVQASNLETARQLPALLARAGFEMFRTS